MRRVLSRWVLCALCVAAMDWGPALAGDGSAGEKSAQTTPKSLAEWIKQLDADDYYQREAAQAALIRAGEAAVKPLQKALEASPGLEFTVRAKRILELIFSETVAGLRVMLTADRQQLVGGGKIRLTAGLANTSDQEMAVFLRLAPGGNVISAQDKPEFIVLKPGQKCDRTIEVVVVLGAAPHRRYDPEAPGTVREVDFSPFATVALPHPGRLHLQVSHTISGKMLDIWRSRSGNRVKRMNRKQLWEGTIRSNKVEVVVSSPAAEPPTDE